MGRTFKILSVGHSYVVGMNRGILREIAKDPEFEVTVIAPLQFRGSLRTIEMEPEPEGSSLKIVGVPAYMTQKMHLFAYDHLKLAKAMNQNFDALHIWEEPYIFSGFQIARLAHKLKIPFCVRTAQSLIKKYPYPFRHFEKKVFQWCDQWVAGGQLVFDAMTKKGWKTPKKGKILTLAVDTDRFLPMNEVAKARGLEDLGLRGPVLGFLGRLSEEKGLDLLMTALTTLKDRPWSFLVMGSGPYEEILKMWALEQGLQDRVRVQLFKHDDIPKVLPLCDLLLCPSQTRKFWKEQFGRMIVEGFAAGVPIVGSDSGEIPKVVGDAGVILPEADIELWTKEIDALLGDESRRQDLRIKGLQRAHKYSAKSLAEEYKVFYKSFSRF